VVGIVPGTVGFDDQPVPEADEVHDVPPQRDLTAELDVVQVAIAQDGPELRLHALGTLAELSGEGA